MTAAADLVEQLIFQRRSIRKYKPKALPQEWIEAMLACAHQAPSPSNSQPVRFVRIESPVCLDALRSSLSEGHAQLLARHEAAGAPPRLRNWINAYHRYAEVMFAAPVLLAVGLDTDTKGFARQLIAAGLMKSDRRPGSDPDITLGLALQGLLLKAQALGVGSCILTAPLFFIQAVEKLLGLEQVAVKCFVTLGLADETPKAPERLPLHDVVKVV